MTSDGLQQVLARAGAVFVRRGDRLVVSHFGSVVGELAVCRHGVGVTDRSDLGALELRGTPAAVAAVVERVTGDLLAPGRSVSSCGARWCPVTDHRVLILAVPTAAADLAVVIEAAVRITPGASLIDLSDDYAAIGLVGPRARRVVRDAGLLTSALVPRPGTFLPQVQRLRPGMLLCEGSDTMLLLVPAAHAQRAWAHLMAAGRVHGISCVGRDALDRLRAVTRSVPVS